MNFVEFKSKIVQKSFEIIKILAFNSFNHLHFSRTLVLKLIQYLKNLFDKIVTVQLLFKLKYLFRKFYKSMYLMASFYDTLKNILNVKLYFKCKSGIINKINIFFLFFCLIKVGKIPKMFLQLGIYIVIFSFL